MGCADVVDGVEHAADRLTHHESAAVCLVVLLGALVRIWSDENYFLFSLFGKDNSKPSFLIDFSIFSIPPSMQPFCKPQTISTYYVD